MNLRFSHGGSGDAALHLSPFLDLPSFLSSSLLPASSHPTSPFPPPYSSSASVPLGLLSSPTSGAKLTLCPLVLRLLAPFLIIERGAGDDGDVDGEVSGADVDDTGDVGSTDRTYEEGMGCDTGDGEASIE
jgi:hypothetical protein